MKRARTKLEPGGAHPTGARIGSRPCCSPGRVQVAKGNALIGENGGCRCPYRLHIQGCPSRRSPAAFAPSPESRRQSPRSSDGRCGDRRTTRSHQQLRGLRAPVRRTGGQVPTELRRSRLLSERRHQAIIVRLFADVAQAAAQAVADAPAPARQRRRGRGGGRRQDQGEGVQEGSREDRGGRRSPRPRKRRRGKPPGAVAGRRQEGGKGCRERTKGASSGVLEGLSSDRSSCGRLPRRLGQQPERENRQGRDRRGGLRNFKLPAAVKGTLFNMTVVESPPDGPRERIQNVSLHPDAGARRIDRVLEASSRLVRMEPRISRPIPPPSRRPTIRRR